MWKYEPVYGTTKNLFGNHHINIQQYENDEGKWFYKIEIDGEIILERENEKPQQFKKQIPPLIKGNFLGEGGVI